MAQLAGSAAILVLQAVPPALAAPHSGVPKVRTGPELSDIALFVVAAIGVFLVRRALRKRFMRRPPKD
jgi:ABC-type nickel/cobalt efflux system permease component RcnA